MTAALFVYFSFAAFALAALFACAFVFRLAKGEPWLRLALLCALLFAGGLALRLLAEPEQLPEVVRAHLVRMGVIAPVVVAQGVSVPQGSPQAAGSGNAYSPQLQPYQSPYFTPPVAGHQARSGWSASVPAWLRGLLPPALRDPEGTAQAFNQLLLSPAWQSLAGNQALWQQLPQLTDQEILNTPEIVRLLSEPGVVRLLDIWSGDTNPSAAERGETLVELLREASASGSALLPNMPMTVALPVLIDAMQKGDILPMLASPYGQMLLSSVLPGDWTISFSQASQGSATLPQLQRGAPVQPTNNKVFRYRTPDGQWRFTSQPPTDGTPYEQVQ